MKKKPFLLIEVLIAFSLVTICSIPLVTQPLKLYKNELHFLEKMENERLAEWSFSEIKELFLKNEIAWDSIPAKGKVSSVFEMKDRNISIPGHTARTVKRSFYLKGKGEKIGKGGNLYRQIEIHLSLNQEKYCLRMPIQKLTYGLQSPT